MPQPSLARNFFDTILNAADPVTAIRALIHTDPARTTPETDWLEFKTEHDDPRQRDKRIKEQWSEALGGFANNQGGVLVWGIEARKTKIGASQIDAACGEKPITDPHSVTSRLVELKRGATDPPLANVEVKGYELPDKPGSGFVLCYVPERPFKPYRSEQAGPHYYLRAGDNFVVMSRSVLEAMFYPRSKAYLWLSVTVRWDAVAESRAEFLATVRIHNDGTGSAKDAVLRVTVESYEGNEEMPYRAIPGKQWTSSDPVEDFVPFYCGVPIHPDEMMQACTIKWNTALVAGPEPQPSFDHVEIKFSILAENIRLGGMDDIVITPESFHPGPEMHEHARKLGIPLDSISNWTLFEVYPGE
jgi:hypothetical protein